VMPAPFQAITPSPDSDCRRCTPDNTSGSSSPLASWECERLPGPPRISHTLAARIQFESRASGRTRSLPLLRRLLEPIDKPLDFRFRQTHLSVAHPDCPKGAIADQAAERYKGNAKAFSGLAASEDLVSRIGSIGRWQAAPPFGTRLFQRALVLHGSRILFVGYPLCWALWYGKASRPLSCCGWFWRNQGAPYLGPVAASS
jgi:hypothetical protein